MPRRLQRRATGINNSIDTARVMRHSQSVQNDDLLRLAKSNRFEKTQLLITVGRLTPKARVDRLIRALAILRDSGCSVKLAIVGDGPQLPELQALAKRLGVADAVIWTGELLDESRLALWMRSACLFVYGGAVGLSLIHAFSYGLAAVISSNMDDHNPEALLFADQKFGSTFDANNEQSLGSVLKRQLENPAELQSMGREAQRMVLGRLGIEQMSDRFVDAIQSTVDRSF